MNNIKLLTETRHVVYTFITESNLHCFLKIIAPIEVTEFNPRNCTVKLEICKDVETFMVDVFNEEFYDQTNPNVFGYMWSDSDQMNFSSSHLDATGTIFRSDSKNYTEETYKKTENLLTEIANGIVQKIKQYRLDKVMNM